MRSQELTAQARALTSAAQVAEAAGKSGAGALYRQANDIYRAAIEAQVEEIKGAALAAVNALMPLARMVRR